MALDKCQSLVTSSRFSLDSAQYGAKIWRFLECSGGFGIGIAFALFHVGMKELFSVVGTVKQSLDYHSRRHNVLASNIANSDTPGFRSLELLRKPEGEFANNLAVFRTRESHLVPAGQAAVDGTSVVEDKNSPVGADGNAVSLDREMSKLSANNLRYETAAGIVKRKLASLRYVATDTSG